MPINMAMAKPCNGAPPISQSAEMVIKVVPDVTIVREKVAIMAWSLISAVGVCCFANSNSRIRSEIMIESFNE
ncbi:Uncharacterised protein [Vibrio cholerae]|uniref:Uncharacterized protein n=1 Tax=Vibrio cholerae TaxID=666 RepID=A0A655WL43_VIBCL|nr:Uncharacterised protein [Vibrio cholerae]CSA64607.1 Uncharacterised protein [Vibrio cholerae]CSB46486.1 Uncharacterised protein [Vibrio cholerae]CSB91609.1 Uncharacterised protein [Vibrio cholerae]CSC32092.1 Uncharacterised protein [Vibrio cholerae]